MAFLTKTATQNQTGTAPAKDRSTLKRTSRLMGLTLAGAGLIVGPMVAIAPTAASAATVSTAPCSVTVNPGTEIAGVVNSRPAGAIICIAAGTHKVTQTIRPKANQQLRGQSGAILEGGVQLSSWSQMAGTPAKWQAKNVLPGIYTGPGQCEIYNSTYCNYAEDIFINGVRQTRVASAAAVKAGTFYGNYNDRSMVLGTNPAGKSVVMASTQMAMQSVSTNVVVTGLTFQHFASRSQRPAASVTGAGSLVTGNTFRDNHGVGLMADQASNVILSNNQVTGNGQMGIALYNSKGVQVLNNTVSGNNASNYWIADWEAGGIKTTGSAALIQGNRVDANRGPGIWADVYSDGMTINANTITNNLADGVRYEISRNGSITNNTVTGNAKGLGRGGNGGGAGYGLMSGAGININTASNVRIAGNTISANLNGISLQDRNRKAGPWGAFRLTQITVENNKVDMAVGSPSTATTGVVKDNNRVFNAASAGVVFRQNSYTLANRSQRGFNVFFTLNTLPGWQKAGFDGSGLVAFKG